MAKKYAKIMSAPVPQSEPLNDKQVQNNAGGFVFQVDDFSRLERFLILGSDAPTYYQQARGLTKENTACVLRCYNVDPVRTVRTIVEISDSGRAPKNDPAIFALALGAALENKVAKAMALDAMPKVCRTGTHLYDFVLAVRTMRGWGRSLKRAVANWYEHKPVYSLGYQAIKYRQRDGYSHKRLLQTSHPKCADQDPMREALYQWITGKDVDPRRLPDQVAAHIIAMGSKDVKEWVKLVKEYNLPWEALPTEANAEAEVWQALLPKMGMTAMIRNLGNMTRIGVLAPLSKWEKIVVDRLNDADELKKARIHPFNLLVANRVYGVGKGFRGSNTWVSSGVITAALENAFYKSFDHIIPANKRTLIGLDVSGSMGWGGLMDAPITPAEGAAAMLMTVARTEPQSHIMGFSTNFIDLKIKPTDSLDQVLTKTSACTMGGTDCAQPMIYAQKKGLEVDTFQVYTDNETWYGRIHPIKALKDYREATGIPAKLIVVGMTSTGFSIADPEDGGALDVVGFDSSAPAIMAEFSRGSVENSAKAVDE